MCILKDNRLATSSIYDSIAVYDSSYRVELFIKNPHDGYGILSLCVLRNGDLVSASGDETMKIWRIGNTRYSLIHTLRGHEDWVTKVIELKDGKLCSCSDDETIKIWDANTYQCIKTLTGHTQSVISIIEIENCIVSSSDRDAKLKIWDKSTFQCVKTIDDVKCCFPNGLSQAFDNTVLVGGRDAIYVIDIQTYKVNKNNNKYFEG